MIKNNIKICVLCMSCNQDIYKYQEMVARNTWIKHLKEENIDVFIFSSGKENIVNNDIIYCNVPDDINHTYEKTICALQQINHNKYDFIIRTNLTTYINAKMLKIYCKYLKDNNFDISNGCLCIKDNLIHYRGNSLIMNKKVFNYLLNNIYDNKEFKQDDFIFQDIFKNINNLKIHSVPFRYYCHEGNFIGHPQSIYNINKTNCEGIIFISYRIIGIDQRYVELGRCYEIDSIYNILSNKELSNNLNIIFNVDNNMFIKGDSILQENSKIQIL